MMPKEQKDSKKKANYKAMFVNEHRLKKSQYNTCKPNLNHIKKHPP